MRGGEKKETRDVVMMNLDVFHRARKQRSLLSLRFGNGAIAEL